MFEADLLYEGGAQPEFRLANINGDAARWLLHVDVDLVAHATAVALGEDGQSAAGRVPSAVHTLLEEIATGPLGLHIADIILRPRPELVEAFPRPPRRQPHQRAPPVRFFPGPA